MSCGLCIDDLAEPGTARHRGIDPTQPVPLANTSVAHAGDPVFVRVEDADQNRDATVIDTVDIRIEARATGDFELLRLAETGPNTGVFVGYMPRALR